DPSTTKYMIQARMEAEGIVEKPDVVGAVFGQTEGLLGEELDLRDLQKGGRIGRIEVDVQSKKGRSEGLIYIPSSLDQVETSILAAALETIDRVGPCKATIKVEKVEDVRVTKRNKIIERGRRDERPEDGPGAVEGAGLDRVRRWRPRRRPDPEGTPASRGSGLHRAGPPRERGRGAHAEADHEGPPEQDPRGPIRGDVRA